jgi:HemK-like putative methylase
MQDSFSQEIRWLLRDKYNRAGWSGSLDELPVAAIADINRLESGEPLAYVIGWAPFHGLEIDLSHRTLIPRSETEYWVGEFLKRSREKIDHKKEVRVLDLCCGSGCIGATVLKHWPTSHVDFVDVEQKAIDQTQLNLQKNDLSSSKFRIVLSDLFSALNDQYDFILTNPPYVDPFGNFSPSILREPMESLFAQKNGIGWIEKIILKSKNHLKDGGEMWLEFGEGQAKQVEDLGSQAGFSVTIYSDQFGRERYASFT